MSHDAVNMALKVRHPDLSPAEMWFLTILADYMDRETYDAFPGQKTLAEDIGASERSILTYLAKLEGLGFIKRKPRFRENGTRSSDLIIWQPAKFAEHTPPAKPRRDQPQSFPAPTAKPAALIPVSDPRQRNIGESASEAEDLFGDLPAKTKPPKIDVEAAFEAFWKVYPRKVSKGAAYAAFVKALDRIKDPDPVGVLMRGVISLSEECEGKDPQFTPHASTWLNQDGFYDEAGARRPQNVKQPSSAFARSSGRVDAFAQAAYELAQERRGRE